MICGSWPRSHCHPHFNPLRDFTSFLPPNSHEAWHNSRWLKFLKMNSFTNLPLPCVSCASTIFIKKLLILCRWMCGKLMRFITWIKIRAAHFLALAKLFLCISWRLSSFINTHGHSCHKARVTCTVIGPIVLFYLTFW